MDHLQWEHRLTFSVGFSRMLGNKLGEENPKAPQGRLAAWPGTTRGPEPCISAVGWPVRLYLLRGWAWPHLPTSQRGAASPGTAIQDQSFLRALQWTPIPQPPDLGTLHPWVRPPRLKGQVLTRCTRSAPPSHIQALGSRR